MVFLGPESPSLAHGLARNVSFGAKMAENAEIHENV